MTDISLDYWNSLFFRELSEDIHGIQYQAITIEQIWV